MSNLDTQIKTFLSVARLGSFRRAADELCVTQAAVTSRIKGLEDYLEFAVFRRHRRGAALTEQGERFIDYARNVIDTIEHGREVARRATSYRAHYRFMSQYLLLDELVPEWLGWMTLHVPDVSISIDCGYSMIATKEIANGQLDLAVGYQYQVTNGVIFEPLFTERLVLVTTTKMLLIGERITSLLGGTRHSTRSIGVLLLRADQSAAYMQNSSIRRALCFPKKRVAHMSWRGLLDR